MATQLHGDMIGGNASSVIVEFDRSRSRAGGDTPAPQVMKGKTPDPRLARACNIAIVSIIALPFILGALALLRRLLF